MRGGGGDVMDEFAHPMSLGSLARFMDLPQEDEPRWFDWVERMFSNALLDKEDQANAVRDAEAYIDELIAERKAAPRDDFMGMLLTAEVDGHGLSDVEVRQFGILMLLAGYETTSGAMGMSLLHLAGHPEQRAQLFGDPAGLTHSAVNELLRFALAGAGLRAQRLARRSSCTARRSRPATSCCSPTARRTTTRARSTSPSGASSTATRTATSPSATAGTSAWARTSPGSSSRS